MKPMDFCLDLTLTRLQNNWDKPSDKKRDYLLAEELLKAFELPNYFQKHEFFKGIIDKLVKDGYAEFLQLADH